MQQLGPALAVNTHRNPEWFLTERTVMETGQCLFSASLKALLCQNCPHPSFVLKEAHNKHSKRKKTGVFVSVSLCDIFMNQKAIEANQYMATMNLI